MSRSTCEKPTTDHMLPHQRPECNTSFLTGYAYAKVVYINKTGRESLIPYGAQ
jgi:hypothetical protein